MIEFVPATPQIIAKSGARSFKTQRAIAAVDGERILGVGGVYLDGARLVMFCEITDELRQDKRAMVKATRAMMALADRGLPVYAQADADIPGSDRLLNHLGFESIRDGVWLWQ